MLASVCSWHTDGTASAFLIEPAQVRCYILAVELSSRSLDDWPWVTAVQSGVVRSVDVQLALPLYKGLACEVGRRASEPTHIQRMA